MNPLIYNEINNKKEEQAFKPKFKKILTVIKRFETF